MNTPTRDTAVDANAIQSMEDFNDRASRDYPSQRLSTGERLHIYRVPEDGRWCVWINTEAADFDGVCIASEDTRDAALSAAVACCEAAVEALQAYRPPEKP